MPHKEYFNGMLKEHIRRIEGFQKKRVENIRVLAELARGEVVRVNKAAFRYQHDPRVSAPVVGVQLSSMQSDQPILGDGEATQAYVAQG